MKEENENNANVRVGKNSGRYEYWKNKEEQRSFAGVATNNRMDIDDWVIDSGATSPMLSTKDRFLGLEIQRDGDKGAIRLSQSMHIRSLMKELGMEICRTVSTPLEANFQVKCDNKSSVKRIDATEYQSVIGSLMYIALCSRPDILHSVCKLSQRNNDPHGEHLAAAKQVLRYLNQTADMAITYKKTGAAITGYADADWAGDSTDRKSYTGYAFISQRWSHVRTEGNPADLASRGVSASELSSSSLRCHEPDWHRDPECWPFLISELPDTQLEQRVQCHTASTTLLDDFSERFSNYGNSLRVTAYILRFATKMTSHSFHGLLKQ
ncbi:uncharacterized mitochondrial protein AtMg00810-like [Drosophila willistoni]|uniref:uncharacterized mitochondrial protein AtMg00810-like n=1 Tax=Drosophila willistoni TaxID=7260 RepID=UPI001F0880D4|nr:uncharacterized mitochondrial protein AtMg00810-like [Drosophila willistoni]